MEKNTGGSVSKVKVVLSCTFQWGKASEKSSRKLEVSLTDLKNRDFKDGDAKIGQVYRFLKLPGVVESIPMLRNL